jgi:hypothetical protein
MRRNSVPALKDDLKKFGYSQEDSYFHQESQRLINEMKEKKGTEGAKPGATNVVDARERFGKAAAQARGSGPQKKAA